MVKLVIKKGSKKQENKKQEKMIPHLDDESVKQVDDNELEIPQEPGTPGYHEATQDVTTKNIRNGYNMQPKVAHPEDPNHIPQNYQGQGANATEEAPAPKQAELEAESILESEADKPVITAPRPETVIKCYTQPAPAKAPKMNLGQYFAGFKQMIDNQIADVKAELGSELNETKRQNYTNQHYLELSLEGLAETAKSSIQLKRENHKYAPVKPKNVFLSYVSLGVDVNAEKDRLTAETIRLNKEINEAVSKKPETDKQITDAYAENQEIHKEIESLEKEIKEANERIASTENQKFDHETVLKPIYERITEVTQSIETLKKDTEIITDYFVTDLPSLLGKNPSTMHPNDEIAKPKRKNNEDQAKLEQEKEELLVTRELLDAKLHDAVEEMKQTAEFISTAKTVIDTSKTEADQKYQAKVNTIIEKLQKNEENIKQYKEKILSYQNKYQELDNYKNNVGILEDILKTGLSLDVLVPSTIRDTILKKFNANPQEFAVEIKLLDTKTKYKTANGYKLPTKFDSVKLGVYEKEGYVAAVQFAYTQNGATYNIPLDVSVINNGDYENKTADKPAENKNEKKTIDNLVADAGNVNPGPETQITPGADYNEMSAQPKDVTSQPVKVLTPKNK